MGWLYAHGVREFEQMSNVAKDLREKLAAHYSLARSNWPKRSIPMTARANICSGLMTGNWSRRSTYPSLIAALYAFPAKSAAP